MHPALSVIFFTVTSGAGFGFIAMLGLGVPMPAHPLAAFLISGLAGGLAIAGLVSSTFHLGHPERAWRAFSQWRSSWLAREGVLALATLSAFALYALFWVFQGMRLPLLGLASSALALSTIYATAMIYAQLKTVPHWHTWLTPACYLAFAAACGLMLAAAFASGAQSAFVKAAPGLVLLSWILKMFWWRRADRIGFDATGSNTASATGLGSLGAVRLLERPHSGENYLTKEMVHRIGRKHAAKLRKIALAAGALLPAALCFLVLLAGLPNIVLLPAFLSAIFGLFIERWLFFAEAKHAVSLYY